MMHRLRSTTGHCAFRIDLFAVLVALLALFPIGPLLQPGYMWQAHDARHSVYFLYELDRGIQDGILYPRWQPDFAFGYGYPFFNIYGPLSSYAGEVFHLAGAGFADAVKIVFGLSIVLSGLAMYGFVRRTLNRPAGLVAAVAYMAMPYRLVDVYVRAALAEAVAFVFVPLVLWGVWATLHRPRRANILGLAFAYAALILTHPLTALLLTVIVAVYVVALALARVNDEQPLRRLTRESVLPLVGHLGYVVLPAAVGLLLGLGLSAFFIVPAMTENRFVRVDQWYGGRYAWGGDFVEFFQLFSPAWGFGTSVPGPGDGMSFQLGAVPVVLSLAAVAGLARARRRPTPQEDGRPGQGETPSGRGGRRMVGFFSALTAVLVWLMLSASAPVWATLPLARLAQFPWRLLMPAVVSTAFLCGAVARHEEPDRPLRATEQPLRAAEQPLRAAEQPLRAAEQPLRAAEQRLPGPAVLVLAALLVLGSLPYMRAEMSEREVSLAELYKFQGSSDEMTGSTAWVQTIPRWSSAADYAVAGKPVTSKINYGLFYQQPKRRAAQTLELHTESELIEYLSDYPATITFDRFYYPGWRAYLLDAETNATIHELPISVRGELGLMTVEVPAGIGRVLVRFEDTPVRKVSSALSWGSLGAAGLLAAAPLVARRPRRARG